MSTPDGGPVLDLSQAEVSEQLCFVRVNGDPVKATPLDCEAPAKWTLMCVLPAGDPVPGKLSVRASMDDLGLVADARLPFAAGGQFEIPIVSPDGGGVLRLVKSGSAAAAGQLGLQQMCPSNPPGDEPGKRLIVPLVLEVLRHPQTGFAEETLAGGVTNRVPTYGPGVVVATVTAPVVQRMVQHSNAGTQAATTTAVDRPVKGRVQVAAPSDGPEGGTWRTVNFVGRRTDLLLSGGDVHLLVLELPAAELDPLAGGDAVAWLRDDLTRWLGGDDSAVFGLVGYARSEVPRPVAPNWRGGAAPAGVSGVTEKVEVAIQRRADAYRLTIAWRAGPFDGTSRTALAEALAAP